LISLLEAIGQSVAMVAAGLPTWSSYPTSHRNRTKCKPSPLQHWQVW